mmetsp:Transcript_26751/g.50304  ORF Transcript_26751/g.50304 Transcript_26751/m.50304 type:complete len:305 (-) Transcript_26751:460-1374(-)
MHHDETYSSLRQHSSFFIVASEDPHHPAGCWRELVDRVKLFLGIIQQGSKGHSLQNQSSKVVTRDTKGLYLFGLDCLLQLHGRLFWGVDHPQRVDQFFLQGAQITEESRHLHFHGHLGFGRCDCPHGLNFVWTKRADVGFQGVRGAGILGEGIGRCFWSLSPGTKCSGQFLELVPLVHAAQVVAKHGRHCVHLASLKEGYLHNPHAPSKRGVASLLSDDTEQMIPHKLKRVCGVDVGGKPLEVHVSETNITSLLQLWDQWHLQLLKLSTHLEVKQFCDRANAITHLDFLNTSSESQGVLFRICF